MPTLYQIVGGLLLFCTLFACEQEETTSDTATLSPSEAVATTPTTLPQPASRKEVPPQMEQVLDTMPVAARAERPVRTPPIITFKKTSHNYDTIQQGEIIEYEFKFKNTGERPLSIKDVKGSCGCTIGSYPFLDIAPNEESSIKARFDSKGKVGLQGTTITVYSNANEKGNVLSLKGFVVESAAVN